MSLPPLGLYIHYPWCERKCPYCDFNSHEDSDRPETEYIQRLLEDLANDLKLVPGRSISTIFIGGGTPSLMSGNSLSLLMEGIRDCVDLTPDLEATMEANPGSAEGEKFYSFREAGITRLSIGIQSFQNELLQKLGRVHDSRQAHAAIEMASAAGFQSFNLDIMHGLPGQSAPEARRDIETALSYAPTHLSWYQLTIEPNTVFYRRPPALPVEDTLGIIQHEGEELLEAAGMRQYEVSAYSKTGYNCRHNLNYWQFGDYLGIGAGAHGKVTTEPGRVMRYAKRKQPGEYLRTEVSRLSARSHHLASDELAGEFMLNALRLNSGFEFALFSLHTGLPVATLQPGLDRNIARGLLIVDGQQVKTTELGRRFLDTVVAEFFADPD